MQLYEQHQGEMDAILASALCCTQEDESRLADIIHAAIQAGEAASHPAFTQEDDRKKQARKQKVGWMSLPGSLPVTLLRAWMSLPVRLLRALVTLNSFLSRLMKREKRQKRCRERWDWERRVTVWS